MIAGKGNLIAAMTTAQQYGLIAEDVARRITQDGLVSVLDGFSEQGLSDEAVTAVLDENDIISPAAVVFSGAMAFKIACDLLAAEQSELNRPADAAVYNKLADAMPKAFECN